MMTVSSRPHGQHASLPADSPGTVAPYRATLALAPTPPFDFAQTLRFIGDFAPGEGEQQLTGATLTRVVRVHGETVVCRVVSTGTTVAPALTCELFAAAPINAATLAAVTDRVSFWLSLTDDLAPFYAVAAGDAAFTPIVRDWYGYHQVKFLTPFENACWAVLAQRSPLTGSRAMKERFVAYYGDTVIVDGEPFAAFPEPADVAGASIADLAATLGHARRADYLRAVIQAWRGVDEQWLRTAPYGDVERWLRGIRGIGTWSAAFVLVRGLGRMERIAPDEELLRATAQVYGHPVSPAEFATIAAQYGAMQGYWGHYLRTAI